MTERIPQIYLVPYAHLDTQWRWEFPTTINLYLKRTLDENFELYEKYPEHCFNFTGTIRYAMMQEYFPEKFERMKEYIKEGRWHVAGTCLDETDALVPSPESMVRNILYGDRWAKRELGRSSRDYMIPDCFGFPANMPSVMVHCGLNGFSSQKLTWKSAVGIPFELGMWQGPDGHEIACAFNPCKYDSHLPLPVYMNPERLKRLRRMGEQTGVWKSFQYYGVGDIGGSPTEGSVRRAIKSMRHRYKNMVVRQGAADAFFDELKDDEKAAFERYAGDLLLINHSAGTLTSAVIMKRWNRKNEQLAFAAEAAAVTADWAAGLAYPNDKIVAAWNRIVGSQMHDILPGTSTPKAYEYSQNDEVVALNAWSSILSDAAASVAPLLKGDGDILLYNPYEESRSDMVNIELEGISGDVSIVAADGSELPCQVKDGREISFKPELPAMGWARFAIKEKAVKVEASVTISQESGCYLMENELYKVKITKSGAVASIYHKGLDKELLKRPMAYDLQKERPMGFPAWNMDWRDRKKPPHVRIEDGGQVSIIEEGPLRCTIAISYTYQSSTFVKEISLGKGDEIVSFTERINWRDTGCSLKLALTNNVSKPEVTYNWETSRIQRGLNHEKQFEMPSHLWVDMSENGWGVSLLEDCKYGYDRPSEDTLRMTLIYTPALWYLDGFWDQKYHDWGQHTIRYAIYGHEGDWRGTDNQARRFNQPVRAYKLGKKVASGKLDQLSLLKTSTPQLGIMAVKQAEDLDGFVVRVYERHGMDLEGHIEFAADIAEAKELNGLEAIIGDAAFKGSKLDVSMQANGIRSYLVKLAGSKRAKAVKQAQLELPMTSKLFTKNGQSTETSFPAEYVPETIQAGAIEYKLAKDQDKDSLTCQGQKIDLSLGTLYILAAATEDCENSVTWLDKDGKAIGEAELDVPSMTGFVGQWEKRNWKRTPTYHLRQGRDYAWLNRCTGITPGYIKRQRLEWYSTHTHKDGRDQAYQYGYMFTIRLEIPEQAVKIALPNDARIKIFAMTCANEAVSVENINKLNDKFDY